MVLQDCTNEVICAGHRGFPIQGALRHRRQYTYACFLDWQCKEPVKLSWYLIGVKKGRNELILNDAVKDSNTSPGLPLSPVGGRPIRVGGIC